MKKATQSQLLKAGIAAMFLVPSFAFAHNYNYLEGGYVHRDQPGDEDGFRVNGSFDVLSPVAIFGEYDDVDHFGQLSRSEERRVGEECVSPCRSRGSPDH